MQKALLTLRGCYQNNQAFCLFVFKLGGEAYCPGISLADDKRILRFIYYTTLCTLKKKSELSNNLHGMISHPSCCFHHTSYSAEWENYHIWKIEFWLPDSLSSTFI